MPTPLIQSRTVDGICTVTLNRPEKHNALNEEMHWGLHEALESFAADDSAQVCVVRGAGGKAFCAGSDLASFNPERPPSYPPTGYAGMVRRYDLDKPVIAAVDGICLGGGFELALACDMILATPRATFGLPEPLVGLIALGGGIHQLARNIGLKQAMGPLLTGRNISAEQGLRMGFVSELVPDGDLDATVDDCCRAIQKCAPLAVRLTKELAYWGATQPSFAAAMEGQTSHPRWDRWKHSVDAREGPANFAAKRGQDWRGR